MAKKARKKSASKTKKKPAIARKKRKPAAKKTSRAAARKKAATPAKPQRKGIIAEIAAAAKAVVDTLTNAERLHHKMEPHVSREPE